MKYATGSRLKFVQLETQFSYEMDKFLSEYAGINSSKYHKALSIILQIHMRAGNTGGYFLSAEPDDIMDDARKFNIGVSELKAIYDVATKRGVFDRNLYLEQHIITNHALQVCFCSAKEDRGGLSMDGSHILNSVYDYFKLERKNKKIVAKLDEFIGKNKSKEQNGIESNENVIYQDDDDMTLSEFKQLHPKKCFSLPEDWIKPDGVKLQIISEAIKKSQKFLEVKNYMTLERLATEFYQKVCAGWYDDSNYEINIAKNEKTKTPNQNFTGRDYSGKDLSTLYDDLNNIEL